MPQTIDMLLRHLAMLGDAGFVLPATGGLAVALWAAGDRRCALALTAGAAFCGALTALAKILAMAFLGPPLYSPSGHAALATILFASLAALLARAGGRAAVIGAAICVAAMSVVAIERVAIGVHSLEEAIVGVAIGALSFALFLILAPRRAAIAKGTLVAVAVAAVALHAVVGVSVEMERPLGRVAAGLAAALR